jgi:succinate-semialdehyde dehydrogenase/glutarate-semialdehyde dehydrogenase
MIILPDADMNYASSAALWGTFCNSGQVFASTDRIFVHERVHKAFLNLFIEKLKKLRQSPSDQETNDLGPIAFESQKEIYREQIEDAKSKNANFIIGGEFTEDQHYLKPTVISSTQLEDLRIYSEITLGPLVTLSTFQSLPEMIHQVNQSHFAHTASIITRNQSIAEEIAKQLEVGTVNINEAIHLAELGEPPKGGLKNSGTGHTHSEMSLYEFLNTRHINKARLSFFHIKSLWWFPYSHFQSRTIRQLLESYRRNWFNKAKAISHFFWNFVQTIKKEKRL